MNMTKGTVVRATVVAVLASAVFAGGGTIDATGAQGQAPPAAEDQAKQDEGWNHNASLPRLEAYASSTFGSR